jgi:uncharacterized MAPEG superfamily protein
MDALSTHNLSFYAVPVAWWLAQIPHAYAFFRYDTLMKPRPSDGKASIAGSTPDWRYSLREPRTFFGKLDANPHPRLTTEAKGRLRRAEYASLNGFEGLGFFSAAVVAANISLIVVHANEGQIYGDELWYANVFSWGYCVARCFYNVAYIRGVPGLIRGAFWGTGIGCATTMFIRAGNALRILVK